ncbi:helix-turn-helix domain-containing protein [Wenjunlia tyrosinilytica]|uniref:XRE family transcriptional regulator n=1 Tax=Wenjunlia tyrosinilytica TaxID=1544741 RepID=A0A917ZWZ6_9ACTN|nr:XRE family transcriptional regulator [Wenjunlia tyrosinilytica]GGO94770.1 XRE family transcriptional regulator [Wenjunlia tyrosinilytica]
MTQMSGQTGPTPERFAADLGPRLRTERMRRKWSIRELARRIGVSASLISQIETGKSQPSVSTLYAIVTQLGGSLDDLFDSGHSGPSPRQALPALPAEAQPSAPDEHPARLAEPLSAMVQRAADRKTLELQGGVRWEQLTPRSVPGADFLHVTYEVGGASSLEGHFQRHGGREWGYIISGRLGVSVGFDTCELGPGDSIAFDSTVPHRLFTIGDEPVQAVWFVLGRRSLVDLGDIHTDPDQP